MWSYIKSHLNFYRIHLLLFIFIPLFSAIIFWASNGEFPVKFIDALFVCVSGVTGTGLSTIDLSSLTIWQQVIIAVLELIGNQTFVAWIVVMVRRQYFLNHLEYIVAAELERTYTHHDTSMSLDATSSIRRFRTIFTRRKGGALAKGEPKSSRAKAVKRSTSKIRPDMVRRVDLAPHLINPMGTHARTVSQDGVHDAPSYMHNIEGTTATGVEVEHLSRITSRRSIATSAPIEHDEGEFGGFPGPRQLVSRAMRRIFPGLHRNLRRTVTMPRTSTLIPQTCNIPATPSAGPTRTVPYFSFSAIVGRNSAFSGLTAENIEELGGVEYRALTSLLWIVPLYYVGLLSISFIVIAPYMTLPRWQYNFVPPQQHKVISPIWFSAMQVMGAWANTGMSLVDQNMVPFQTAYPMIVMLVICVLAGNTCLPIFLRFLIWVLKNILPAHSRTRESLHFLLDHPRRCFIYLFPARQTWLLFGIVLALNFTNWFFDLILNIGNPLIAGIPTGVRVILAVLQAAAVRSAGFSAIPMSEIVPAVQVLYVIMMYIAIYPIAMSVRATNVYEEKSLGVYEEKDNDDLEDESHWNSPDESRVAIWGKYLVRHARRQLSFDMWWLALTLFLLCIIERDGLTNPANVAWFNIFALLFELVSAYGTVGLSLGTPTANYSLSGVLHTLSKLMLCAVMIRGRHRGLPVALDRAVLFPHEFRRKGQEVSNTSATRQEDTAGHDREDSETHDRELPALRASPRAETISLHDNERSDAGIGTLITEKMTEVDPSAEPSGRHVTVA